MTATELLETAFAFADTDLTTLSPHMGQRVKREVGQFLLSVPVEGPGAFTGGVWAGSALPSEVDDREVDELQRAVRRILSAVASRTPIPENDLYQFNLTTQVALVPVVAADGDVILQVAANASIRERYLLLLQLLLRHVGAKQVRLCPACSRPFLRRGRAEYCARRDCDLQRGRESWQRNKKKWRPGTTKKRRGRNIKPLRGGTR